MNVEIARPAPGAAKPGMVTWMGAKNAELDIADERAGVVQTLARSGAMPGGFQLTIES